MNNLHPYFMHSFTIGGMDYTATPGMKSAFLIIIGILAIWSLIWKGFALWHSARNHQKAWFIIMIIVNTLGILEIVYLLFFQKNKNNLVHTTTVTETHTVTASTPAAPSTEGALSAPTVE